MVNLAINLPGGKVVLTSSWRRACQEHWLKCRVEKPRAGMESRVEYRVGQKCEWVQNGQRCDTRRLKNETLTRLLSFTFRPLFFLYSLLVHFLIHFLSKSQVSCLRDFHFPRISMLPSVTFSPCNKRAGAIKPCTRIRGEHTRGAARRQSPFVLEIALICQARTGWFCEWRRNHCAITGNERIAEANHPPCRLCIRSPYTAPRFNDRILGMATSRNKGYYPRLVEGKS